MPNTRTSFKILLFGTKYHMERSTDERNLERDERQQLSQCLDQFRVSAEKSMNFFAGKSE